MGAIFYKIQYSLFVVSHSYTLPNLLVVHKNGPAVGQSLVQVRKEGVTEILPPGVTLGAKSMWRPSKQSVVLHARCKSASSENTCNVPSYYHFLGT
ncbi:hypothetical protein TNCV_1931441 [Trichonephila clavipes]|nr:hypothetical protein TNCV_1931441 [Trichonephila clavipes]